MWNWEYYFRKELKNVIHFPKSFNFGKRFMKPFIFLLLTAIAFSTSGQIKNTAWQGYFNLPNSMDAVLSFGSDSVSLATADGQTLEIMVFRTSGDTVFLKKISGQSSCDMDNEASYITNFKEKKLFLLPVKDDCDQRRYCFPTDGLTKVEP